MDRRDAKKEFARELRANPTPAEKRLGLYLEILRPLGFGFKAQVYQLGWIVDLWCAGARLAVEVDGPYHADRRREDALRDAALIQKANVVTLRFTNDRVFEDVDVVVAEIYAECLRRTGAEPEPYDPNPFSLPHVRGQWRNRKIREKMARRQAAEQGESPEETPDPTAGS